jgi:hypothetical protein
MYRSCTAGHKQSFFLIDVVTNDPHYRFRKNFTPLSGSRMMAVALRSSFSTRRRSEEGRSMWTRRRWTTKTLKAFQLYGTQSFFCHPILFSSPTAQRGQAAITHSVSYTSSEYR